MEISAEKQELFELIGVDIIADTLDKFMSSPDSDQCLDELYYISEKDPEFRVILIETFEQAMLGNLNELDLAGFKFRVRDAFANRYASQELTFLIVFVLSITLVTYTLSPIPDTDQFMGSRMISSAMFANALAAFVAMYRSGVTERRAIVHSEDIAFAMRMYNRSRYKQIYLSEGEA